MKKFLSLVLALVMTMSLVTVASAAEYKDDASIKYEEAVAVISGAGIVGGYADGTFNPTGSLTRQAAAKILCNLTLGTTAADALGTTIAPYKDVPADSQFAGYIAYCAQMGYISGYADGTFRPTATLTGFAFLKMLECALGYDQTIEGLVGTNWAVNVARLALEKDLIDGNDAFVGSKAITREEACLYALNTLEARPVKYDSKGTNITTTDGTVVNVGATSAEIDTNFVTLAAKCQKKLTGLTGYGFDNFDGPSRTVKFDGKEIGTFSKTADKVYVGEVKYADLYKDFGLDSFTNIVYNYGIDGQTQTANGTSPITITKGDDDNEVGADGALTYVYKKHNAVTGAFTGLEIVTQKIYGKKITAVSKNTAGDRIVKMAGGLEFKTEDFAKGDIVFVTMDLSEGNAADQVQSMVLAEKQTGKIEKYTDKDYTIDGTKLKKVNANTATIAVGDEVEYYVTEAGTIGYMVVVNSTADVSTLAYVEDCGSNRGNYAVLRFADGTKKTVDTDKDYYVNGNLQYYIVKVSETTSGEYKLTAKSDISNAATANASTAYTNGKTAPTSGITSIKVDNNTVFLYKTGTTYKQYVGKDNAPSFANTYAIASYTNTGVDSAAAFVYVDVNGSVTTPSSKLTVIAFKDSTKVTNDKDDVTYYEYKAIVDGEVSTLKVDTSKWSELYSYNYDDGYAGYLAVKAYQTDANGVATWQHADQLASVDAGVKVSNGVIYVAGGAYAYTDDAVVYFVDNDSHKVSVGTIDDILEDDYYSGHTTGDLDPYGFASVKTNDAGKVTAVVLGVNP